MSRRQRPKPGFTLIEMMITVAVMIVLLLIAIPSFQSYRQRAALRASADRLQVLWNQARFEAAKRNTNIQFVVSTANNCVGFAETAFSDPSADTACNCNTNSCGIANFPGSGSSGAWNGVTLTASSTTPAPLTLVIIEPKHTFLTTASSPGAITINGPTGAYAYKLYMRVDKFGRAVLCEPPNASKKLPEYGATRTCLTN